MGIEKFFSAIQENKITNLQSSFTNKLEKQLDTSYLYIDFNSIVYIVAHKIISDLNSLMFKLIIGDKNIMKISKEYNLENYLEIALLKSKIDSNINNIIIEKVLEYVINIVTNYINPDKLKKLYIAIDGVPSKSKMVEQRKRRYMGMTIEKVKEKIFLKYEKELQKDNIRYTFEKNKIRWSTINITPGTIFMDNLVKSLISSKFDKKLKSVCKNLEEYIFSGPYEPGEGEKKIIDNIRSTKHDIVDDYVIYSPDSDVTLLCLLLNINLYDNPKVSRLKILRHNQQKENYDVVDIDKLSDNLYNYVVKELNIIPAPNKDSVISDIVLILTIFGNDFIPKIQAFDVKNDFDKIINKYITLLKENNKYIINYNKKTNKREINLIMFKGIIKLLKQDEGGNLQKIYITSHYQNYDKLKKVLGADHSTFTEILNNFLSKLREMNNDLTTINKNDFINKWSNDEYSDFINKLKKITRLSINKQSNNITFLNAYTDEYKITKQYPKVNIYFRPYKQSLNSDFHQERLNKSLNYLGQMAKITKYDEEIYKFDNMLDEYQKKLLAYKLKLGYISIDHKTYTWKTEKIIDSVKKFYKDYFGITDISIKNNKMEKLIHEYIRGLLWVFNFYFNNFNEDDNRKFGDSWFYPYNYAPLMTQIYEYLLTISEFDDNFENFKIPREDYFNCLEHLMYVSPAPSLLNIIPEEYRNFAKTSSFYPDLNKIVDSVINDNLTKNEIDCRGQLFLNKCHITKLHINRNFNEDKKFISTLRQIPLSSDTKKRRGSYKLDNLSNIDIIEYNLNQYGAYKRMYLDTKEYKYKKLYKISKYRLMKLLN